MNKKIQNKGVKSHSGTTYPEQPAAARSVHKPGAPVTVSFTGGSASSELKSKSTAKKPVSASGNLPAMDFEAGGSDRASLPAESGAIAKSNVAAKSAPLKQEKKHNMAQGGWLSSEDRQFSGSQAGNLSVKYGSEGAVAQEKKFLREQDLAKIPELVNRAGGSAFAMYLGHRARTMVEDGYDGGKAKTWLEQLASRKDPSRSSSASASDAFAVNRLADRTVAEDGQTGMSEQTQGAHRRLGFAQVQKTQAAVGGGSEGNNSILEAVGFYDSLTPAQIKALPVDQWQPMSVEAAANLSQAQLTAYNERNWDLTLGNLPGGWGLFKSVARARGYDGALEQSPWVEEYMKNSGLSFLQNLDPAMQDMSVGWLEDTLLTEWWVVDPTTQERRNLLAYRSHPKYEDFVPQSIQDVVIYNHPLIAWLEGQQYPEGSPDRILWEHSAHNTAYWLGNEAFHYDLVPKRDDESPRQHADRMRDLGPFSAIWVDYNLIHSYPRIQKRVQNLLEEDYLLTERSVGNLKDIIDNGVPEPGQTLDIDFNYLLDEVDMNERAKLLRSVCIQGTMDGDTFLTGVKGYDSTDGLRASHGTVNLFAIPWKFTTIGNEDGTITYRITEVRIFIYDPFDFGFGNAKDQPLGRWGPSGMKSPVSPLWPGVSDSSFQGFSARSGMGGEFRQVSLSGTQPCNYEVTVEREGTNQAQ